MNVEFDSKHTTEDDEGTTDNAGNDVIVAEMERNVVGNAADDTSECVDFFSENQGLLVDEDVTKYTAAGSGHCSHDNGSPKRETTF